MYVPEGNILWDHIATLDDTTKTLVAPLGGLKAIAISHSHYYIIMQDRAVGFSTPIYLHASDRGQVVRDGPWVRFWDGGTIELTRDITMMRLGGHFAGGYVLYWTRDEDAVLSDDIVQVTPGAHAVSFIWDYPNMLPSLATTVSDIIQHLRTVKFKQPYGVFEDKDITQNTDEIARRSGEEYISCLKQTDSLFTNYAQESKNGYSL